MSSIIVKNLFLICERHLSETLHKRDIPKTLSAATKVNSKALLKVRYTVAYVYTGFIFAENHYNLKNLVPSMLLHKLCPISMGMKQKNVILLNPPIFNFEKIMRFST